MDNDYPDPVEFAYQRYGRHLTPGDKTGWLSCIGRLRKDSETKKEGEKSNGMMGTSVYISDSSVHVFGPDYAEFGFPAVGETADAYPFAHDKLFAAPTERWMMVSFGKSSVQGHHLHLNRPGDKEVAYFSNKKLVRVRYDLLTRIAETFLRAGIAASAATKPVFYSARHFLSGQPITRPVSTLFNEHPDLLPVIKAFIESGMSPPLIARRMRSLSGDSNTPSEVPHV